MKKRYTAVTAFLLASLIILAAFPIIEAQEKLAKPTVKLPSGWEQSNETTYPYAPSEHDPQGAGMVEYTDQEDYDVVRIYYERAPSTAFSDAELRAEAISIFETVDDMPIDERGVTPMAGTSAGFAKGYEADLDTYTVEYVLVKGGYYLNVHAYYDATTQDQNQVVSLIDSISVSGAAGGSLLEGTTLYIIIGVVVAVVVVVVILVVALRRRKRQPKQAVQYSYPAPPPPPPIPTR
ncbi:MAG: hypothetical protein ACE14S_10730 [Candidatus Bathyarchaeia archaeon]